MNLLLVLFCAAGIAAVDSLQWSNLPIIRHFGKPWRLLNECREELKNVTYELSTTKDELNKTLVDLNITTDELTTVDEQLNSTIIDLTICEEKLANMPGVWSEWVGNCSMKGICLGIPMNETRTCSNPTGFGCEGDSERECSGTCGGAVNCTDWNDASTCFVRPNTFVNSFQKAVDLCASFDAQLASINSVEENDLVIGLVPEQIVWGFSYMWFGLNRFETGDAWAWSNGDPVTYTNWDTANGEPNSASAVCAGFIYAQFNQRAIGTWADLWACYFENTELPTICRWR